MKSLLIRPTDREGLFVWLIHRFAEVFENEAVLKGGLVLRLLDSPRLTNDVDFVLVPYSSKKEVLPKVRALLAELSDAEIDIRLHSKMLRATIRIDGVGVQVECAVASECPSIPMTTAAIAEATGYPPHVIRVMRPSVALAHKLAAWNERRLIRDLYDAYFFVTRAGVDADTDTLRERLQNVQSRKPELKKVASMTIDDFKEALSRAVSNLTDRDVDEELAGLLSPTDRAGLSIRIRTALSGLLETLGQQRT